MRAPRLDAACDLLYDLGMVGRSQGGCPAPPRVMSSLHHADAAWCGRLAGHGAELLKIRTPECVNDQGSRTILAGEQRK